jgi:alkylation response protein AidB-like acyl-CoA dehydrogenase
MVEPDQVKGQPFLAAIASLTPLFRAEAAEADRRCRLTEAVARAMVEQRLYRLWIPRAYDGEELPLPESLLVFEAASRADGSAGWAVTIGTGGGLFAAVLEEEAAKEIFSRPDALIAGSGSAGGQAVREAGGYRASGRWAYASGAHQATCFTANCIVQDQHGPDGGPLIRAMAFEPGDVEIIETWTTSGMRGTGSHDFSAGPCFVPARRTFSVFTDKPRVDGPLYRFPFASIAEASFAAVALGIGRHAMDEFTAIARTKRPRGSPEPLSRLAGARVRAAEAEITLVAARSAFLAITSEAWDVVAGGGTLDARGQAMVKLASIHAATSACRAADLVCEVAGTGQLRMDEPLGRCWRDVHAVSRHALLSPAGMEAAGAVLLGGGEARP